MTAAKCRVIPAYKELVGVRNMREKSEEQERVVSVAQALVSIVF
jgi:hypothetical protein